MTFEHLALASVCVACLSVGFLLGLAVRNRDARRVPEHPTIRRFPDGWKPLSQRYPEHFPGVWDEHGNRMSERRLTVIDGGAAPYDWKAEGG